MFHAILSAQKKIQSKKKPVGEARRDTMLPSILVHLLLLNISLQHVPVPVVACRADRGLGGATEAEQLAKATGPDGHVLTSGITLPASGSIPQGIIPVAAGQFCLNSFLFV